MLDTLKADRSRLAVLEAQIRDLERSLSALRAEHDLVQERLDAYKYPILTLPPEIPSEIFIHFLPPYPDAPLMTGLDSPTNLTQICSQWRQIALTNPALWRATSLVDSWNPRHRERQREISEVWLKRSGSCSLSIHLRINRSEFFSQLCAAVLSHRARWEHLRFSAPLSTFPTLAAPMPLLRYLEIEFMSARSDDEVLAFHDVPQLHTVVLRRFAAVRVTLPWGQLTCLTCHLVNQTECVAILRQATRLVHCIVLLTHEFRPTNHAVLAFTLPRLESLVLRTPVDAKQTGFVDHFVVPALRRLELDEEFLLPDLIHSLESFISRSGCSLQELHIERPYHRRSFYISAFPSIPNVSFTNPFNAQTE